MPDIHELTASDAARAIATRSVSAQELMAALLKRSSELEPRLRVWAHLDADAALEAARARDVELATEGSRGPLHGVPVGVKDIYYVRGAPTAAGSPILAGFEPLYDSTAVARLRRAGAIVMGKTVTTEFACGDPPPTRNAWNAERTPGGSSSGSAVGVAARMFPVALGSQTAGSVLRPAAFNGVVGLKPTLGRISRYGVVPVAESLDTMGHFAHSVADAALLLGVMAGHDPNDPASSRRAAPASDAGDAASPPKIGLLRSFYWERAGDEARQRAEDVSRRLADAGATVADANTPTDFDELLRAHRVLMTTEAADVHRKWFAERADDYSPNVRGVIEDGIAASALDYLSAKRVQRAFRRDLSRALADFDVLLTPTTPAAAPADLSGTGDPMFQTPFTFGGFPAITLPAGLDGDGMPLGVQLASRHWDEERLLRVAAWCERVIA